MVNLSTEDAVWLDEFLSAIHNDLGKVWWRGVCNAGWLCDEAGNEMVCNHLSAHIGQLRTKRLLNRIAWFLVDYPLHTARYDEAIRELSALSDRYLVAVPSLGIEARSGESIVYTGNVGLGRGLP
jgi:hypothetical protein